MSNYITENRTLIEAIFNLHKKFGIEYELFSEDWVLRLRKDEETHFVYGYGFDINSQVSTYIAQDKVATFELLDDLNINAVPHHLLSSMLKQDVEVSNLNKHFKRYKELVIKPNRGSRGESVAKFNNPVESLNHIKNNYSISWAASPYINIRREIRIVILKGSIVFAYEKFDPVTINGLKMFNLNLGAKAKSLMAEDISEQIQLLAKQSMKAIGLNFGAVDIVLDENDTSSILEINSAFSLEHYALISPENRRSVVNFYETIIKELFTELC